MWESGGINHLSPNKKGEDETKHSKKCFVDKFTAV
jgi:hypothetical protein